MANQQKKEFPVTKNLGGRPRGIKKPSTVVRLPDEVLAEIDDWASFQSPEPSRAEAIGQILARFLKRWKAKR